MKLGLDGTPMGTTFGLELPMVVCSRSPPDGGDVGGSESTGLMVGVAVGRTIISSSEYSEPESSSVKLSTVLDDDASGKEVLLDVRFGSSSHMSPVSTVEETSQVSLVECSSMLLRAP